MFVEDRPEEVEPPIEDNRDKLIAFDIQVDLLPGRPANATNPLAVIVDIRYTARAGEDMQRLAIVIVMLIDAANLQASDAIQLDQVLAHDLLGVLRRDLILEQTALELLE